MCTVYMFNVPYVKLPYSHYSALMLPREYWYICYLFYRTTTVLPYFDLLFTAGTSFIRECNLLQRKEMLCSIIYMSVALYH